ncbi:peptidylprolyl isomerase [Paenibacillus albiflavus]|uniref:Peptidylprolyl isomerase n=1 Tax=Paenibacillus albiflavus TaxID=2545760 RepID=A0A4R4DZY5_9BACL|nr:peptidylprolyl isomerase [Paenibacillus albiflavus]TCZ70529.1 peptidylprolyl isomerase [Paenibacillus albiflavus]
MFQSKQSRWVIALIAVIMAVSVLGGCGKSNKVLATYKDNSEVTQAEFDTFLNVNGALNPQYKQVMDDPTIRNYMLEQYIGYKMLAARADDAMKAEADKLVNTQMEQIKLFLGAQEGGLDKQLKDNKIKLEDIENLMKWSFYSVAVEEKEITDEQIKAEYDNMLTEDKHYFDVTTVRHILIGVKDTVKDPTGKTDLRTFDEALARAKEVEDKLKAGGDFDALAKEYSDDPGSKDKGGKYENLNYGDMNNMVPEWKDAAMSLPVGQLSGPVKTDYGYHIIRVDSRKVSTVDEMKDSIRSGLAQMKVQDFVEKEVPGLILTNNLPSPTPEPSATPAASTTPAPATESPAPTATPNP